MFRCAFDALQGVLDHFERIIWRRRSLRRLRHKSNSGVDINKTDFLTYLSSEPVIFEVGAHGGNDSEEFALLFPKAQIYCFEPDPRNYAVLQRRTRAYESVHCLPFALGDNCNVAYFWSSSGGQSSSRQKSRHTASGSLLRPTGHIRHAPEIHFKNEDRIAVAVASLDAFASLVNVQTIDLLWIDAQGGESGVLNGGKGVLTRTRLVYLEVCFEELYEGASSFDEIQDQMKGFGFELVNLYSEPPTPWGNALFKNAAL